MEVFPWIGVAATLAIGNGEGVLTALAEQPLNSTQTSAQNTFQSRRICSRWRKPMLPPTVHAFAYAE
jgi:hypothetical protein